MISAPLLMLSIELGSVVAIAAACLVLLF